MRFKTLVLLTLGCLMACAQTNVTIDLSAGGYLSSSPHSSGDFSFIVAPQTSAVSSYTTFELRPLSTSILKGISTPNINTRTGIQWVVWSSGKVELAALLDGGVANGASGTSLTGATGGKLSVFPFASSPGFAFNLTAQELGQSASLGGWNPLLTIGTSYTFNNIGTLSTRRKLARVGKTHRK